MVRAELVYYVPMPGAHFWTVGVPPRPVDEELNQERDREHKRRYRRRLRGIVNPSGETRTGACEICREECDLVYDHDHVTGLFRGWLCNRCNSGLGWFRDNQDTLLAAASYLRERSSPAGVIQGDGN